MSKGVLPRRGCWSARSQAALVLGSGVLPAFALVWLGTSTLADPLLSGHFVSSRFNIPLSQGIMWAKVLGLAQLLTGAMACLFWGRRRLPAMLTAAIAAFPLILVLSAPMGFRSYRCGCYGSLMGEWLAKSPMTQIAISGCMTLLLVGHSLMLPSTPAKTPE